MTAPLIGISTYRERAAWGVWDRLADILPADYADLVASAGGAPVLLPPADLQYAGTVVARLDGLIIAGGADVDPSRYGQAPHERTANWRPERDAWECALLDEAAGMNLPTLGICRGMQLMAVHAGGSLVQHTPDVTGTLDHGPQPGQFGSIPVSVVPGSRLASLVGTTVKVNCHHHQHVAEHPGFVAAASAQDGTLEAMEAPGERFYLGVQWHPEEAADTGLLAGFIRACRLSD
ncbi:MAG TPA: gamma-glutamyl-gamma-aminobutyrate hydrolase family protein [Marmoricola sp.]|nr:gamma-glutamyl-gamma-aminobutyrate hydrolase family protein [Marmoricola sp.]